MSKLILVVTLGFTLVACQPTKMKGVTESPKIPGGVSYVPTGPGYRPPQGEPIDTTIPPGTDPRPPQWDPPNPPGRPIPPTVRPPDLDPPGRPRPPIDPPTWIPDPPVQPPVQPPIKPPVVVPPTVKPPVVVPPTVVPPTVVPPVDPPVKPPVKPPFKPPVVVPPPVAPPPIAPPPVVERPPLRPTSRPSGGALTGAAPLPQKEAIHSALPIVPGTPEKTAAVVAAAPVAEAKPKPVQIASAIPIVPQSVAVPAPKAAPIEPQTLQCQIRPATVEREVVHNPKLSLLIIVDTSPSHKKGPQGSRAGGELIQFASEIPTFLDSLPKDTKTRIAVMTGNGPDAPSFAKLVKGGGEPVVLDSARLNRKQMIDGLRQKMLNLPEDRRAPGERLNPSQGEAIFLALNTAFSEGKYRAGLKDLLGDEKNGKFEIDADRHLAIIIVQDEQEVCFTYPDDVRSYRAVNAEAFLAGRVPVLKPYPPGSKNPTYSADTEEMKTYDTYCKFKTDENGRKVPRFKDGHALNFADVEATLRTWDEKTKGKVMVNSITYLSNKGLQPLVDNQDENEMGHGVIDLVEKMDGEKGDLAQVRQGNTVTFTDTLARIGRTTSLQMEYNTVWDCYGQGGINPAAIDPDEFEVTLLEARGSELDGFQPNTTLENDGNPIATFSSKCKGSKGCNKGVGGLTFQKFPGYWRLKPSNPQQVSQLLKDRRIEGAKYRITFKTKRDIDPKTGQPPVAPVNSLVGPNGLASRPGAPIDPAIAAKAEATKVASRRAGPESAAGTADSARGVGPLAGAAAGAGAGAGASRSVTPSTNAGAPVAAAVPLKAGVAGTTGVAAKAKPTPNTPAVNALLGTKPAEPKRSATQKD